MPSGDIGTALNSIICTIRCRKKAALNRAMGRAGWNGALPKVAMSLLGLFAKFQLSFHLLILLLFADRIRLFEAKMHQSIQRF